MGCRSDSLTLSDSLTVGRILSLERPHGYVDGTTCLQWNMVFQGVILHFHVSSRECIYPCKHPQNTKQKTIMPVFMQVCESNWWTY